MIERVAKYKLENQIIEEDDGSCRSIVVGQRLNTQEPVKSEV